MNQRIAKKLCTPAAMGWTKAQRAEASRVLLRWHAREKRRRLKALGIQPHQGRGGQWGGLVSVPSPVPAGWPPGVWRGAGAASEAARRLAWAIYGTSKTVRLPRT